MAGFETVHGRLDARKDTETGTSLEPILLAVVPLVDLDPDLLSLTPTGFARGALRTVESLRTPFSRSRSKVSDLATRLLAYLTETLRNVTATSRSSTKSAVALGSKTDFSNCHLYSAPGCSSSLTLTQDPQ